MSVNLDYEIELLSRLVEINTESVPKKGYDECAQIIIDEAEKNGLKWEIVDGQKGAKDGLSRPNVIISLDSGSDTTLLVESHFDVVPTGTGWKYPPFKLTVEEDKAYGRGTADNKAGIAAALGAMRQLSNKELDFNIKLIAGVDEEIGGRYGVDYVMNQWGLNGDAALIVDAGPEGLFLGASGIIWGKITITGKQGHAGYPFKAKNAIHQTMKLLTEFKNYQKMVEKKQSVLRAPTGSPFDFVWGRYSVTMINAGEKENVIPGTCEARFDRRLLPEEPLEEAEEELMGFFQKAVEKTGCEATLELVNRQQGYHTSKDLVFVQTVLENIKKTTGQNLPLAAELGGNDGSFFAQKGIPVICHGTIREDTRYHGIDEFVYLQDMKNTRDLIINLGKEPKTKIK
ncbi:MAG: ArgE/DapE family deacylase [Candidatus Bathyarchaeota archaeon]|nr:ArgE/DapE family deacylase [Candidatus Bathyarchaeum tardum]WGM88691.1 MAG: ArgE/DapE family deacylase [Candidatus Bathyarchaeum tardum]WNZ29052.1 MAG: ArgE/DapE family deacylase [Candidatus Bathyarchaeota archaeon]